MAGPAVAVLPACLMLIRCEGD